MKRLFAVLGDRVQNSLSPRLHTAAGQACDIDLAYVPVVCRDVTHFQQAVAALRTVGAVGANVTIPYKQAAADLCDRISLTAQEIGAINTLTFSEAGPVHGTNTDGPALVRLLSAMPAPALHRVQVFGAGGAARAVTWALKEVGAGEVFVSARRGSEDLAAAFAATPGPLASVRGVTLVISTLPGEGELARSILEAWTDLSACPYVYDVAYGGQDGPSPLVSQARAAGLRAADGLGMLVEQAALALSLWTGGEVDRIRQAMKQATALSMNDDPFDSDSSAD